MVTQIWGGMNKEGNLREKQKVGKYKRINSKNLKRLTH